jgi:hypothetical protein
MSVMSLSYLTHFPIFLVAIISLFLLRYTFFPLWLEPEQDEALNFAARLSTTWYNGDLKRDFLSFLSVYNGGFGWIYAPFYSWQGYSFYSYEIFASLLLAVVYATFLFFPWGNSLIVNYFSFIPVISLATTIVSLRRYKWHGTSWIAQLAMCAILIPTKENYRYARLLQVAGVGVFIIALFLYHGNIIYLPLFIFFYAITLKVQVVNWLKCNAGRVIGGVVIIGSLTYWIVQQSSIWTRFSAEFGYFKNSSSLLEFLKDRSVISIDAFFLHFTQITQFVFVLGLYLSIPVLFSSVNRKQDRFTVLCFLIVGWASLGQFLTEGLNNPDWHNWMMFGVLGILIIGWQWLIEWSRVAVPLALICAYQEFRYYPYLAFAARHQVGAQPGNEQSKGVVAVKYAYQLLQEDSTAQIHLPSEVLPTSLGGFEYHNTFERQEFLFVRSKVKFFRTLDGMVDDIKNNIHDKGVVILNSEYALSDAEKSRFAQQGVKIQETIEYPFSKILYKPFPLRVLSWKKHSVQK